MFFGSKYLNKSNQYTINPSKLVQKNTVLLCVRAPVGVVNITPRDICIGRGLAGIANIAYISTDFIYYWLQALKNDFISKATGTTFIAITGDVIQNQLIPIPPLAEQKRIVSEIEKIFNQIEIVKENQEELSKLKDGLKNKILDLAIQGKLVEQDPNDEPASELLKKIKAEKAELVKQGKIKKDKQKSYIFKGDDNRHYEQIGSETKDITDEIPFDIPNNWKWVRLETIGSIVSGGTPKTEIKENWENGTIPWLTPADMKHVKGKYVECGERFITEQGLNSSSATLMPENSIVYSSRAPIGYIAITKNSLCTNQGFKSFVSYDNNLVDYIYYILIGLTDNIISRASGTTFKEISGSEFARTLVPLPPISEQNRIVKKIATLSEIIVDL